MPLVITWKTIGTLMVIAAGALPLADAGMSLTTWPVSFSRIVPRLSGKPPRALTPPPSAPQAHTGRASLAIASPGSAICAASSARPASGTKVRRTRAMRRPPRPAIRLATRPAGSETRRERRRIGVWQPAGVGPGALALVLTAAVLHAVWNLAAKGVTEDRLLFIWLYAALSVVVWVPVGVVWVVVTGDRPQWVWLGAAALSAAMHIGYQLALQRGYAEGELNVVYPVARGTGPLLTFVIAATVLDERPGVVAGIGVLLVVVGVLLISWSPGAAHGNPWPGVLWGLLTGVGIAAYTLWDSHAVTDLDVSPVPYFVLGLVCQVPVLTLMARRRIPDVRRAWPALARPAWVVALLSPVAYILVLRAMQEAPVALVAAARESSIVVGALFGWLVLKEARPLHRLVGSVVVAVGIAAIVIG